MTTPAEAEFRNFTDDTPNGRTIKRRDRRRRAKALAKQQAPTPDTSHA